MAWSGVEFIMDYVTLKMNVKHYFNISGTKFDVILTVHRR